MTENYDTSLGVLFVESYVSLLELQKQNVETFVQMQDVILDMYAVVEENILESRGTLLEAVVSRVELMVYPVAAKGSVEPKSDQEGSSFLKSLTLSKISLFKTVRDYWIKRSSNMADKVKRVCAVSLVSLLTTVSGRAVTLDCFNDYEVTDLPNLQEVKSLSAKGSDSLTALGLTPMGEASRTIKGVTPEELQQKLQDTVKQRLEIQRAEEAKRRARLEAARQEQERIAEQHRQQEAAWADQLDEVEMESPRWFEIQVERSRTLAEWYPYSRERHMAEARIYQQQATESRAREEANRQAEQRRQQEAEWQRQLDAAGWGSVRYEEIQAERYRAWAQWFPEHREYYTREADRLEQQAAESRAREEEARRAEVERLEQERLEAERRREAELRAAVPAEAGAYEALKDRLLALDGFQAPLERMRNGARIEPGDDTERRAVREAFWKQVAQRVDAQAAINPEAAEGEQKYLNVIKLLSAKVIPDVAIGHEDINDDRWRNICGEFQVVAEEVGVEANVQVEGNRVNSLRQIREWLDKLMEFRGRQQQLRNQALRVLRYLETLNNDEEGNKEKAVHIFKEYIIENSTHCKDRALSGLESIETYMKIVNSPDAKTALGALIQLYKKQIIERHLVQYFETDDLGRIMRDDSGHPLPKRETVEQYLYLMLMLNQRLGLGIPQGTEMGYARLGGLKTFDGALEELAAALINQDQLIGFLQNNEIWQSILHNLPEYRELEQRLGEERTALTELTEEVGEVLEKISDGDALTEEDQGVLQRMAESAIFRELKAEKEAAGDRDALKVFALIEGVAVEDLPAGWYDNVWGGNYDGLDGELYTKIGAAYDQPLQGFTRQLFEAEYCVTGSKYAGFTVGQIAEMQAVVNEAANPYPEDEEQRIARELAEARAQLAAREAELQPQVAPLQALIDEDTQRIRELEAPYEQLQTEVREAQDQLHAARESNDEDIIAAAEVVLRDAQAALEENNRQYEESESRCRQNRAALQALRRDDAEMTRLLQRINDLAYQQNHGHFGGGW